MDDSSDERIDLRKLDDHTWHKLIGEAEELGRPVDEVIDHLLRCRLLRQCMHELSERMLLACGLAGQPPPIEARLGQQTDFLNYALRHYSARLNDGDAWAWNESKLIHRDLAIACRLLKEIYAWPGRLT